MSKYNQRGGAEVTQGYITGVKENYPKQYPIPKYLLFIEKAIAAGYKVILYMPRNSVSKYVTVSDGKYKYKIRFSNHQPIKFMEAKKTCDFFVGVTNFSVTTSDMAWNAMQHYFGKDN